MLVNRAMNWVITVANSRCHVVRKMAGLGEPRSDKIARRGSYGSLVVKVSTARSRFQD